VIAEDADRLVIRDWLGNCLRVMQWHSERWGGFGSKADFAKETMKRNQQATEAKFAGRSVVYHEIDLRRPSDITTGVLWVVIPYTSPELTQAALRHAGVCTDLNVHVSLVDIQVVPFPCALTQPPVDKNFSRRRLCDLLAQSGLPGRADVVYARDWLEGFRRMLQPQSLVILATKKRWWRTREDKLARALLKAGHQVMLLHV
jgi:hypothetical protein